MATRVRIMTKVIWIGLSIVMIALVTPSVDAQQAPTQDALLPDVPRGKGEACVEPVADMRRNHMKYILHQRDDTVLSGIRTSKHSLHGCIDCHAQTDASQQSLPVNGEGQFCQSCHSYVAVQLDCFDCHSALPQAAAQSARRSKDHHKFESPPRLADLAQRFLPFPTYNPTAVKNSR